MNDGRLDPHEEFHYEGFSSPNGTIVPDDVFDVLAPRLGEAELRVLLYIIRRTFGFKKETDNISLSQLVEGITTRDGRVLDRGAGVSKSAAVRAVKGLIAKGIITVTRNQSTERGFEPTTYRLRFKDHPLSSKGTRGGPRGEQALVPHEDKQQTVGQETDLQGDVVAEMQQFGISPAAARKLVVAHPTGYILGKLELAQWLVDRRSPLVARNAAGWLRRAIEEDYQPPAGARRRRSRPVVSASVEFEASPVPAASPETPDQVEAAFNRDRDRAWRELRERYPPQPIPGTGLTTAIAWQFALEELKREIGSEVVRTWLRGTEFIRFDGQTAVVVAPTRSQAQRLTVRFDQPISRALGVALDCRVACQYCALDDLLEGDGLVDSEPKHGKSPASTGTMPAGALDASE
jgi:hypothetical protein